MRATYSNFTFVVRVDVVWSRDGEVLCEKRPIISESVRETNSFAGCEVDDGVRLTEFTSGEYAVTSTLDSAPIGGASRFVTVPERSSTAATSDSLPGADLDVYQFTAPEGAFMAAIVDTISLATAFDIKACLSTTPTRTAASSRRTTRSSVRSHRPRSRARRPSRRSHRPSTASTTLLVDSSLSSYAGPIGEYEVTLLSPSEVGPLEVVHDNVR